MDPTSRPHPETRRWLERSILQELSWPDRTPLSNSSRTIYTIYTGAVTRSTIADGSREHDYFFAFSPQIRYAAVRQALQRLRRRGLIRKERLLVTFQSYSGTYLDRDWVWWPTGLLDQLAIAAKDPT